MNENIYLAIIFAVVGAIFIYRGRTGNTPDSGPVSLNNSPAPDKRKRQMNTGVGIAFIIFGLIYAVSYLLRTH